METVNRRATYRLYPTPAQAAALDAQREAHRGLYNAALEQRRAAWKCQRVTVSYAEQCRDLTELRHEEPTPLPAQAAQHTLKRVALAFEAFFRRSKAGVDEPGYPRFKSRKRLKGWSYPTHGDGWRLLPREGMQHGRLRLSGIGHVRIRGDARTVGEPKTCDILYRHGTWYASITVVCQPQQPPIDVMYGVTLKNGCKPVTCGDKIKFRYSWWIITYGLSLVFLLLWVVKVKANGQRQDPLCTMRKDEVSISTSVEHGSLRLKSQGGLPRFDGLF